MRVDANIVSAEDWAQWEVERELQAATYDRQRRFEAAVVPAATIEDFRLWELEARANQAYAELASAREHLGLVADILADCLVAS